VYTGSDDDAALNAGVERFTSNPAAAAGLARFATSGKLSVPLVNLHTTGDPIVPVRQSQLYADKVKQAGSTSEFTYVEIERFGHCTFDKEELLSAFSQLWEKIGPVRGASELASR
jgi:alpha-beta hydrolase superfamily lysophospholipase